LTVQAKARELFHLPNVHRFCLHFDQYFTHLEERESILHGKQAKTRSRAESMAIQELNFNKAFLAGTAIIASVLFAIVWARFK